MRVLTCVVAFNEERLIGSVLDRCRRARVDDVIVLNDGSTDRTAAEALSRGVCVVDHLERRGVGAAIRTAIRHAQRQQFDVIVIIAGNGKDTPEEIPRLLTPIAHEGYDFVQGSRYMQGGIFGNMPLYRRLATQWIHPLLFSLVARHRITDSTNGFRAIRLTLFTDQRIDIDQDWLNAYELEPYIFYKTLRLGYRVKEVPVTKVYPPGSYTKMRPVTGWWSILRPIVLLSLGLRK